MDASFEQHADEMQMMTWQNATHKQMAWQRQRITGGHLAHRIRGVTWTIFAGAEGGEVIAVSSDVEVEGVEDGSAEGGCKTHDAPISPTCRSTT